MTRKITARIAMTFAAAVVLPVGLAFAQAAGEGTPTPQPPNVPAPGEPRAQEQLPEAPPGEMLESAPPMEKQVEPPAGAAKPEPAPMPNTLPPAKKIEPKVPNT
ncbi:MAG: hypothetical protein Q7T86_10860 [Hyphomicrobiaceae bacterium]|nr:hypothetical protein [Hyphomicrobiaceae bacterium]